MGSAYSSTNLFYRIFSESRLLILNNQQIYLSYLEGHCQTNTTHHPFNQPVSQSASAPTNQPTNESTQLHPQRTIYFLLKLRRLTVTCSFCPWLNFFRLLKRLRLILFMKASTRLCRRRHRQRQVCSACHCVRVFCCRFPPHLAIFHSAAATTSADAAVFVVWHFPLADVFSKF